jgi:plastocyanin
MKHLLHIVALLIAAAALPASAANVTVAVGGRTDGYYGGTAVLKFNPSNIEVNVGDTVTFINEGGFHNVVADDGSFRCALGCDGDGQGGSGAPSNDDWTAQVRFTRAGTFGFHCENHAAMGMTGTVVVRESTTAALGAGFSGAWYNASQSGHGFLVQVLPNNVMLVVWFVYSPDGSRQNWILAQGAYDPTSRTVTLPAYLYENGRFPPNFDAASVTSTSWGTLTLSFADCSNGTASWAPTLAGYSSGSMAIVRLASIAGTTCP